MTNSRTVADRAIFIRRRLVQRGVMVIKKRMDGTVFRN